METENINDLQAQWVDAKEAEDRARKHRIDLEVRMIDAANIGPGSGSHRLGRVNAQASLSYKLDPEAVDLSLPEVAGLVRWKAELNYSAYKQATDEQREIIDKALTVKPSKVSFSLKRQHA